MKGKNFHHHNIVGLAVAPKDYNGVATVGATIKEPWTKGRQLSFILIGGAFASSASLTCVVQGQKRSDDSWVTLKEHDGSTDLEFTQTKLDDTAEIEGGALLGTIPLNTIDVETYKALRLLPTGSAHSQIFGASYIISDLYTSPSGQEDDLFSKTQAE